MKKTLISVGVVAFVGVVALTGSVSAANSNLGAKLGFNSTTTASSTIRKAAKLDQVTAKLQTRADKEIDRRITALTKLQDKIQGMKKITVADKSSFAITVQGQINLLNNLKVKINADTDAATLKVDVQSITKAYRVYALILPQIEIIAGADRLASTTSLLSAYSTKLQTRITTAQAGGKDVTALQTLIADMNTKIADANVQSAKAIAGVVGLVPDNGDKTVMDTNLTALKAARTAIKAGTQDVKDAQKDGKKIMVALKVAVKSNTATSTASTTAE